MVNQSKLSDAYYAEVAKDLGLNMTKFNSCYSSKKYQSVIDADVATGETAGVTGTPATFINGQLVSGAVPYSTLKGIIDAELAK
jgi:protein-disulfide isomerase